MECYADGCIVPFQQDIGTALDELRRQVFAVGKYLKPSHYGSVFNLPEPSSVDDLFQQEQYWEFMGTSGTHSIIDVPRVVPADFDGDEEEEFGTIRLLSEDECTELFGSGRPDHAAYDLVDGMRRHEYVTGGRWTGRAVILWSGGAPNEIAFWGYSGD
jgi:hypothetical protein